MFNQEQGRKHRPIERSPYPVSPLDGGPKSPDVTKPDVSKLLKRMRNIEKDTAKKYRQVEGE